MDMCIYIFRKAKYFLNNFRWKKNNYKLFFATPATVCVYCVRFLSFVCAFSVDQKKIKHGKRMNIKEFLPVYFAYDETFVLPPSIWIQEKGYVYTVLFLFIV